MINTWCNMATKLRINPGAVARQLLANLKTHKALSLEDERKIVHAIESTMIPNAKDRLLASLSRNTIQTLLENMK